MASEKQILANRRNALRAGVKTAEGKAIVRNNAVSHGIFTREILLPGEDSAQLTAMRDNFMKEYDPVGEMETVLVERVISSTWRLRRTLRSDCKVSPKYIMAGDDSQAGDMIVDYRFSSWQLILKYETTIERQIYRALHELERLQRTRKGENIPLPLTIALEVNGEDR